jgi:hypothetical protein
VQSAAARSIAIVLGADSEARRIAAQIVSSLANR